MKTSTQKYIISLLLFATILGGGMSCSNENSETKNSTDSPLSSADTLDASNMQTVSAEILTHGEEAHKTHCYKCHTDDVYTRDNRFVKSIDALSKQVVRCKDNTDAAWFDEDSEAVVQFLNQKYYKF